MTPETLIPESHPRAASLKLRERLLKAWREGIVVDAGLLAHGRGEAFDYIIGERTTFEAQKAGTAAAAILLQSENPLISVNGNSAALAGRELVELAELVGAKLEVNLFYRSEERASRIANLLKSYGANRVLGVDSEAVSYIPGLASQRGRVDPYGIMRADTILVPLEDGDRTQALRSTGKRIISIDLNPLSRTSTTATVAIVDNIVRAVPYLASESKRLSTSTPSEWRAVIREFDNRANLAEIVASIGRRLEAFREKGDTVEVS